MERCRNRTAGEEKKVEEAETKCLELKQLGEAGGGETKQIEDGKHKYKAKVVEQEA